MEFTVTFIQSLFIPSTHNRRMTNTTDPEIGQRVSQDCETWSAVSRKEPYSFPLVYLLAEDTVKCSHLWVFLYARYNAIFQRLEPL